MLLARGRTTAQAVESLGHVLRGWIAHAPAQRAQTLRGVDMPITSRGGIAGWPVEPPEAVATLMRRDPFTEFTGPRLTSPCSLHAQKPHGLQADGAAFTIDAFRGLCSKHAEKA